MTDRSFVQPRFDGHHSMSVEFHSAHNVINRPSMVLVVFGGLGVRYSLLTVEIR